ncbi:MAG: twin-arginine translocase TatA/TatE family subunit [Acidobacteriota bacterium]
MFDSPVQIAMVVGVIVLLFGGSKLPQLARSIGQSSKAFKEGLREAEDDPLPSPSDAVIASPTAQPALSTMSDEALMEEMRRRVGSKPTD